MWSPEATFGWKHHINVAILRQTGQLDDIISNVERCCYRCFYVGVFGHNRLPLGGFLSLCQTQECLCGLSRAFSDIAVFREWMKFQFGSSIPLRKDLTDWQWKPCLWLYFHSEAMSISARWNDHFSLNLRTLLLAASLVDWQAWLLVRQVICGGEAIKGGKGGAKVRWRWPFFSMGPIRGEIATASSVSGAVLWFDPVKLAWNNGVEPSTLPLRAVCQTLCRFSLFPFLSLLFVASLSSLLPGSLLSRLCLFSMFLILALEKKSLILQAMSLSPLQVNLCRWMIVTKNA